MNYLLTGGTGWIGRNLIRSLDGQVWVVTRDTRRARGILASQEVNFISADLAKSAPHLEDQPPCDVVINLAGESIAGHRWTSRQKAILRDSRIQTTRNLVRGLLESNTPPRLVISASATGIYGDRGDELLTESSRAGKGFLPELADEWERETAPLSDAGIRVVNLRIGLVIGPDGGVLKTIVSPFRLGLGGRLGNGQQWMPWIHLDDLISAIHWLIHDSELAGPVNAVGPDPVRNSEFTQALAKAVGRTTFLNVPSMVLKLLAGEMSSLILSSQRVVPNALFSSGFRFQFTGIRAALENILGSARTTLK